MSTTGQQTRFPAARFAGLVGAYGVSTCGNYLNLVALALFTYEVTGSGLGVGLLAALRLAAGSLAGLVAGWLVGRFDRRKLMIGTDLGQAAVMTALAASSAVDVVLLGCAVAVMGAGNSLFTVALRSAVPTMVGARDRVRVNGLLVTAKSVAMVFGFASAGPLIAVGGFRAAFAFNAASFVVSAVALAVIRVRAGHEDAVGEPVDGKAGVRVALAGVAPVVLLMVALRGVDALASSSHNTALPVFATTTWPDGPAAFMSWFWVAWAVGVLLAHQVVTRWGALGVADRAQWAFGLATCVMALSFTLAFTGLPVVAMACVVLVAGLADGVTEIAYVSRLQEAPDRLRGRLFGLSATVETSGFAVGMVVAGGLLEVLPPIAVVALLHGPALCAAAAFLLVTTARRHRHTG